jgi:hypothetical protein
LVLLSCPVCELVLNAPEVLAQLEEDIDREEEKAREDETGN